jgi:hypothetical protein
MEKKEDIFPVGRHPVNEKQRQKESRAESDRRGRKGRAEHKGKAKSTNKPYGGKMAM